MAENPKVNLALVNDIPDGSLEQGTIYMSPDVSGNFIKVAVTDSSTVTIFDGSVYTTALNDLNNRIDNIDVELLTNITYSELKALRDTSALVPGMQYRITDYECTTSAENTSVGGHAFDIIVTADSSSKLNENARAIQNEGENYFDNANLLTWELKYAIDNDGVYSWASQDGKGVVYYMKDEFDNECGYDFKNIKFAFVDSSSALIDSSTHYYYTFTDASTDGDLSMKKDSSTICEKNYIMAINDGSVFTLPHTVFIASNSVFNNIIKRASNNVFGTAYNNDMGMIEDCVFDNVFDLNTVETALNTWLKGVAEANHIKYISNSEFGNNFAFNTIRYMSNTKAGDGFMLNDVGDYFLNSSFGNNCFSNFFGPYSGTITTGNDFAENTMQNQCHHLTFGNSCKFNNMGTVGYVRMGNNCTDNFIGNGKYIYFGNSSNQGADWICGNKFEGITQYVYFYNTGSASLSNMLRKYHMYNICGTSDSWKSISETTRNNSKETFVLTRPGYTTPAANSLIYVDPAMLPERTKGGTAGQILVKVSGTDYDMGWRTVNIGSQIAYDSSNKVISLKDASGNVLGTPVDATDFIKDGMVSDVSVYDGNLVISFNTDAGKEDISIPLSHIFDSSNYYTKSESDTKYVWDSSSPWEPGSGTGSAQLKGSGADASGNYSVAEGASTIASENYSHAEGDHTIASGVGSHAEGYETDTSGNYSHAEGAYTIASGNYSHAEGTNTSAIGDYSHAEGTGKIQSTTAPANILSVTEDWRLSGIDPEEQNYFLNITDSYYSNNYASIIQKRWTDAVWELYNEWHNNGKDVSLNLFSGFACDSDSFICDLFDADNIEEYEYNDGEGGYIHGLLFYLDASIAHETSVYNNSIIKFGASGEYSHTEGVNTIVSGVGSHAEGMLTEVKSDYSHAEGYNTIVEGRYSHAEGYNTLAYGYNSHAEGEETVAIGNNSHAEGYKTNAYKGHAEGVETWCFSPYSGGGDNYSHAEGQKTQAYLVNYETASDLWVNAGYKEAGSHAEGLHTISYGYGSHSSGRTSDMYGRYGGAPLRGNFNGNYYYDTSVNIVPGTPIYTRRTVTVQGNNQNKLVDVYGFGRLNSYYGGSRKRFYTSIQGYPGYFGDTSSGTVYALTAYSRILAAIGNYSTANGIDAKAYGSYSHAEGAQTLAVGAASHSEGHRTSAVGRYSHAEGYYDIRGGSDSVDNSIGFRFAKLADYAPTSITNRLYAYEYDPSYRNGGHDVSKGLTIFDGSNYAMILDKATYYYNGRYFPYFVLDNSIGTDYLSDYNVLVANGTAKGMGSHIEGTAFLAYGMNSHAEGDHTYAIGKTSHAEGKETFSIGKGSHAEGDSKDPFKGYKIISFTGTANSSVLHVDSDSSTYFKVGNTYRIENDYFKVLNVIDSSVTFDHPFRQTAIHLTDYKAYAVSFYGAIGDYSHVEGRGTITYGTGSHAEGCETTADASYSHAEGYATGTSGQYSHAEGGYTVSSGQYSHAEGGYTVSSGQYSHAEGGYTVSSGDYSHAEGEYTKASGIYSHAEGNYTTARGMYSHAEGTQADASGHFSHAEGNDTKASGSYSHAEGSHTKASGSHSHAEGFNTDASGNSAHAEGAYTKASGTYSHAEGKGKDSSYAVFRLYMSTCMNGGTSPNPATFSLVSNVKNPFKVGDRISCSNGNVATVTEVTASGFKTDTSICSWFNTSRTLTFYLRNLAGYDASNNISDASGLYSHTEGIFTQAFNEGEHANGFYNLSNVNVSMENDTSTSTLFTIGYGGIYETDSSHWFERKNAVEVMRNGAIYITGVGGYNGTNPGYENSSTLQEVINNSGGGGSATTDLMTNVTYSELKTLRDSSSLVPGMQYYIYDYVTTVGDASLSSAMHPFGIIVTANSPSELNENARIRNVEGNDYYTNLDAYEIKYCIDNDSSRFGWADPNGTGIIYYMKDDNRNEACYDFTNILFDSKYTFDYNSTDARLNASANIHDNVIGPHYGGYTSAGSQQTYYTLSPNNIVFEGLMNYNNIFGNDCYDLKFANQTMFNTFGGAVWDCSFGATTIYNHFGSYITGNVFPAKLATSDIGSNTWYVNVSGTTSYIRCIIMPNTKGTSTSSRLSISITETGQHAGLNSSGVLKKWLPADLID